MSSRVEVLSKNNLRLAVNSCGRNFFTGKRPLLFALNAVKAMNFVRFAVFSGIKFFHRIHRTSYKKAIALPGFEPLTSCMSPTSYSTAPSGTYFNDFSCEFKISVELSGENL